MTTARGVAAGWTVCGALLRALPGVSGAVGNDGRRITHNGGVTRACLDQLGALAGGDAPHLESAVIAGVLGIGGGGGDGDFEPEGPELALPALAQILKAARSMYDTPDTRSLESAPEVIAPDGSTVRPLCQISGLGSFAHFQLEPGEISKAVSHATVQEIWYIIGGTGKMWRRQDGQEPSCEDLRPGICLTIPLGTTFQFRADNASGALRVVAVTMPPWPADSEHEARPEEGPWITTFRH